MVKCHQSQKICYCFQVRSYVRGQKDLSDSLPEYELLDAKKLEAYIEKARGRADLLADGFDENC